MPPMHAATGVAAAPSPSRPAAVDGEAGAGDGCSVVGAEVPHQRAHLGPGTGSRAVSSMCRIGSSATSNCRACEA